VVYDKLADRWLISQFTSALSGESYYQCVAVSTSADATGTYAEVIGWSRRRDAGGSNQVSLRRESGRYAHDYCVRLAVLGVDPANQGSLLDTAPGKA